MGRYSTCANPTLLSKDFRLALLAKRANKEAKERPSVHWFCKEVDCLSKASALILCADIVVKQEGIDLQNADSTSQDAAGPKYGIVKSWLQGGVH